MDATGYTSLVPHVEFFYYHSNAQHHIDGVMNAPGSFVYHPKQLVAKDASFFCR